MCNELYATFRNWELQKNLLRPSGKRIFVNKALLSILKTRGSFSPDGIIWLHTSEYLKVFMWMLYNAIQIFVSPQFYIKLIFSCT